MVTFTARPNPRAGLVEQSLRNILATLKDSTALMMAVINHDSAARYQTIKIKSDYRQDGL